MCLAGNEEENEGDRGSKVTTNKFEGKAELKGGREIGSCPEAERAPVACLV